MSRRRTPAPASERLLTIADVAERCQVSPRSVRRWIDDGRLRAIRLGRSVRVCERDLAAFPKSLQNKQIAMAYGQPHNYFVITPRNQSPNLFMICNHEFVLPSTRVITRSLMSSTPPSRSITASPPSLADVLAAVARADLPERRRQDLASAVRSVARALGRPPEQVPADPRLLGKRLAEVAPQALGLSRGRWSNIRSLLRTAIQLIMPVAPGRHRTPLSPAWKALWVSLESQTLKTRLSRLFHFCSARASSRRPSMRPPSPPSAQYLDTALLKNPAIVYRACLSAWNTARATVPGWPDFTVAIPERRDRWTLPWEAFPSSLRADTARWLDRLAGRDLLEELPFRPVRPATLRSREYQIRQFASALVLRGRDPSTLTSLADLVAIDAFKDGLRFLLERHGNKPTSTIADLAATMKAIARHHVRRRREAPGANDRRHSAHRSAPARPDREEPGPPARLR